ncbi:unnamed protein product [Dovyalis caffra]|uniref:Uncharacterized protein n=1 Tax=Dovyalis caffra TaxID=77055 RepID=A0AAV1S8M8_9ROSI|nr:unnamed protein product [Dovyalis caffra]
MEGHYTSPQSTNTKGITKRPLLSATNKKHIPEANQLMIQDIARNCKKLKSHVVFLYVSKDDLNRQGTACPNSKIPKGDHHVLDYLA